MSIKSMDLIEPTLARRPSFYRRDAIASIAQSLLQQPVWLAGSLAQAGWLAGWVGVWHTPVLYQNG